MTACAGCSAKYMGGRAQHCCACHQTFGSTEAGDRHRTGSHGIKLGADRRRCLIGTELLEVGLELNDRGHWVRARELGMTAVRVVRSSRGGRDTRQGSTAARPASHQGPSVIATAAA